MLNMALYNPLLVKKLENILKKDPNSKSFCALAHIYRSEGDIEKAENLCLEGINHNPSYSPAYVLLGEIYKDQGKTDKALKSFNKAKELSPDNPNIYKNLGEIYKKQNDMEKTLSHYKTALFLKPEDKTAILTVRHLEKILGQHLTEPDSTTSDKKEMPEFYSQSQKNLSVKQIQKMAKLNKILARVENYISTETSKSN